MCTEDQDTLPGGNQRLRPVSKCPRGLTRGAGWASGPPTTSTLASLRASTYPHPPNPPPTKCSPQHWDYSLSLAKGVGNALGLCWEYRLTDSEPPNCWELCDVASGPVAPGGGLWTTVQQPGALGAKPSPAHKGRMDGVRLQSGDLGPMGLGTGEGPWGGCSQLRKECVFTNVLPHLQPCRRGRRPNLTPR